MKVAGDGLPFAHLGQCEFVRKPAQLLRALAHTLLELLIRRRLGFDLLLRRSLGLRDIGKRDDHAGDVGALGTVRHDAA